MIGDQELLMIKHALWRWALTPAEEQQPATYSELAAQLGISRQYAETVAKRGNLGAHSSSRQKDRRPSRTTRPPFKAFAEPTKCSHSRIQQHYRRQNRDKDPGDSVSGWC